MKEKLRFFLKIAVVFVLLLGAVNLALAQQSSITGTVTDDTGQPLPGVTIVIKGTTNGTVSNMDGNYSISNIQEDATLVFSFVGMLNQEVEVGTKSTINITMQVDAIGIEEVVAIGYGTQKKGNLTGSVSTIKEDGLTIAPVSNVTNTLTGQIPGLITKQLSGQPGADGASLSIRGFGSPLIIVDGVQSDLNYLDPSQIESISILKDGSASIYGARAGNGVILVTTKRGRDKKPTITLNSSFALQGSTKIIEPMSSGQRAQWAREVHINSGLPLENVPFTEEDVQKYYDGTDPNYLNSDWFDAIIRPWAPQQNHNLSVSGGSEKIKYYGSFGFNDSETVIKKDGGNFTRYNLQSNIDAKITDNINLAINSSYTLEDRSFSSMGMGIGSNFWNSLYWAQPYYPITLPDPSKQSYDGTQFGNPFWSSSRETGGYQNGKRHIISNGVSLNYDFEKIKGLQAKAFVNYFENSNEGKSFMKRLDFYTFNPNTQEYTRAVSSSSPTNVGQSYSFASDLTQQYSVIFKRTFNQIHNLSVLVLYESINSKSNYFSAGRSGYLSNSIDQLFAGSVKTASNDGSASEMGRKSWVSRINYIFNNRYLLESIFRYDGSAKFPPDTRWGLFPSISLGWVISEEDFINSSKSVDNIKLRASYGQSGNDAVGNFQYLTGYGFDGSYIIGEQTIPGIYSTGLANPFLTWEKISISNLGVDFSFFKQKIYGTVEGFYRLRDGIPGTRVTSLPSTFGAALPPENLNSMDTRGFEVLIGTAGTAGNFSYELNGNISWSRSKWVKYEEPEYTDPDQERIYQRTGQWTDRRFGYVSEGLFTSQAEIESLSYTYESLNNDNSSLRPGDVKYLDINNDKVLNWKDQVEIGEGGAPHWMFGLNTTLKYNNFSFIALFQGAWGYTANVPIDLATTTGDARELETVVLFESRWTEENNNPAAAVARPGGAFSNRLYSDYRNHSVSYLRLKSASLNYNVPKEITSKLRISDMRIFLAGTNVFTLSSLSEYGVDPEIQDGIKIAQYYPQQRIFSLGVNLSF
jgi:TonB-linked SusC/RagA family outer membrane protein